MFLVVIAKDDLGDWAIDIVITAIQPWHARHLTEMLGRLVLTAEPDAVKHIDLHAKPLNASVGVFDQLQHRMRHGLRPKIAIGREIVNTAAVDAPDGRIGTDHVNNRLDKKRHSSRDKSEIASLGLKIADGIEVFFGYRFIIFQQRTIKVGADEDVLKFGHGGVLFLVFCLL